MCLMATETVAALLKQQAGDRRTHLAEAEKGEVLLSSHANSWGGAFFLFR
jgi:hypothetical protein